MLSYVTPIHNGVFDVRSNGEGNTNPDHSPGIESVYHGGVFTFFGPEEPSCALSKCRRERPDSEPR